MSRAEQKDRVFLDIAIKLGELGTCDRAHVGCVITKRGRCVSWGFNGAPPGVPHCEDNHGWVPTEWRTQGYTDNEKGTFIRARGCKNATHAEANALSFAARQGISTEGGTCYVVVSPCVNCARLLIAAGIVRVVWSQTYRDPEGSQLLETAGVEKEILLPEGYIG